ncbi:uncharacterized protein LOC132059272 [Lycium ferocissimum]|uniref:uncharacterized protein LOC132059272 n=1 Tax=Lycium ferocissimum TaxID=112874 RepID=UPI002815A75B|nr:uncharacterized protein LOC132059272 [Lycium ferocissimum]XP_059307820.1 uncharacterized protein LOC132059272 [Lycium ferocissimum]XP_059307821.1 uncharacterized protein LOC132059272 [Lycium ferocissimum]XP_059307822.1 uncharacterized protein LOC132059272 [Lycium ferocissimum]XP_059307823.1 uncharacterized protein LOC132059272 [Lycium ferocissimum]XP_059307824.1 uncharacterized protein LOC132059272 [Lycium ferocissimum]XP_059307825.1 uncharacterized protein LOC132059272 [Lycium ferocissimu
MMRCVKVSTFIHAISFCKRCCHFESKPHLGFGSLDSPVKASVGIFWDLDNKPPKSFPPFDAATKLKKAAGEFGAVRFTVAYANRHAFSYVPPLVRQQRKERKTLNSLENRGVVKVEDPYICRVCGRRFYTNEKLVNHFKQIHEREHTKRMNQIDSSRGKMRVKLVAKYAMKMDKYKYAVKDVLTPKVGYGLADELKRAGFWVRTVSDKPQAADIALRNHLVDVMDKRMVDYVVLVSDDSDFVEVLKEARLRCLKTVVVGDTNDGALKRTADAAFSWQEIMMGKAKKEAVSVVGRWKDRDVLKRLEWTYDPEIEKKMYYSEVESDDSDGFFPGEDDKEDVGASVLKEDGGAWWKLDSRSGHD